MFVKASDFGDELESDNEGSFLSSAGRQRTKHQGESDRPKVAVPSQQVNAIVKIDAEVQVKPGFEDQHTSTGDVLSTK